MLMPAPVSSLITPVPSLASLMSPMVIVMAIMGAFSMAHSPLTGQNSSKKLTVVGGQYENGMCEHVYMGITSEKIQSQI